MYLFTRARENRSCGGDGERIVDAARQLVHRWKVAQPHEPVSVPRRCQ
jgi:hypothetical protein